MEPEAEGLPFTTHIYTPKGWLIGNVSPCILVHSWQHVVPISSTKGKGIKYNFSSQRVPEASVSGGLEAPAYEADLEWGINMSMVSPVKQLLYIQIIESCFSASFLGSF